MESGLRYGGFTIYHDGSQWVAQIDGYDDPIMEIGSQSVDRLLTMIDEHNHYVESLAGCDEDFSLSPEWLKEWYESIDRVEIPANYSGLFGKAVLARIDGDKTFTKVLPKKCTNPHMRASDLLNNWLFFDKTVRKLLETSIYNRKIDLVVNENKLIVETKNGPMKDFDYFLFSHYLDKEIKPSNLKNIIFLNACLG